MQRFVKISVLFMNILQATFLIAPKAALGAPENFVELEAKSAELEPLLSRVNASEELVMDDTSLNALLRKQSQDESEDVGRWQVIVDGIVSVEIRDGRVEARVSLSLDAITKIPEIKDAMELESMGYKAITFARSVFGFGKGYFFNADVSGTISFNDGELSIEDVVVQDLEGDRRSLIEQAIEMFDMTPVAEKLKEEGVRELSVQDKELRIVQEKKPKTPQVD